MIDKKFKEEVVKELSTILARHKNNFVNKGLQLPLLPVSYLPEGLLRKLPEVTGKTGWPWNTEVKSSVYHSRKEWPKITIVVPSYNQAKFLEEAIRSILLQNYPNLELIIMDGGSNDTSKDILEKYSPWISYWQSEKDEGQGQAINMGFSIASGNYYGWLNSDDFYNKNTFLILGEEIIKSKKDFYYGDALVTNQNNSIQTYWKGDLVKDIFLRFGGLIASHSAFWKSTINKPVWEAMNCNVDSELWIRLVKNQSRKYIKAPLGTVRLYEDTKSADIKWKEKWKEDDINIARVHGNPPQPRSLLAYLYKLVQKIHKASKPGIGN